MPANLSSFIKKKDFLICVDSDGCAMDTMDCKHIRCFGPYMIEEWGLEQWSDDILARWNEINLYSSTRGINRFKALAISLTEIGKNYRPIDGIEELNEWVEKSSELSNKTIQIAAAAAKKPCLGKALAWSQKVNAAIAALPPEHKKSFANVREGLLKAHDFADVAVVSSANREAVTEEWQRSRLLECVDVICCQDVGSKMRCIEELAKKGYAKNHILMVGDAPGDEDSSRKAGVYFYPILVRHEAESWQEFAEEALPKFQGMCYDPYGKEKSRDFASNLGE